METFGWIVGTATVVAAALDQVPRLCRKAQRALRAIAEVRDEVRRLKNPERLPGEQPDDIGEIAQQ
ncbi:hypothetical protein [Streptomyces sp. LN785]|uniref:hypothetical protein n=1 Tax=Streptomyces sp. LN785 TaxID=3112983 RepID=UPI00371858BE